MAVELAALSFEGVNGLVHGIRAKLSAIAAEDVQERLHTHRAKLSAIAAEDVQERLHTHRAKLSALAFEGVEAITGIELGAVGFEDIVGPSHNFLIETGIIGFEDSSVRPHMLRVETGSVAVEDNSSLPHTFRAEFGAIAAETVVQSFVLSFVSPVGGENIDFGDVFGLDVSVDSGDTPLSDVSVEYRYSNTGNFIDSVPIDSAIPFEEFTAGATMAATSLTDVRHNFIDLGLRVGNAIRINQPDVVGSQIRVITSISGAGLSTINWVVPAIVGFLNFPTYIANRTGFSWITNVGGYQESQSAQSSVIFARTIDAFGTSAWISSNNFEFDISPSAIADLSTGIPTITEIPINWTSTGDDGLIGTGTSYQVRWSTSGPINNANWASATPADGIIPVPAVSGTSQGMTVINLPPGTQHWFSVRTVDDLGNVGSVSNSPSETTLSIPSVVSSTARSILLLFNSVFRRTNQIIDNRTSFSLFGRGGRR